MPDPPFTGNFNKPGRAFDNVLSMLANIPKGILGVDPTKEEEQEYSIGPTLNKMIQLGLAGKGVVGATSLLKAGLPFAAIRETDPVFHGTQAVIKKFNPLKYTDRGGLLSGMTHYSEETGVADKYATGLAKSKAPSPSSGQNIIPGIIENKNTLDLTQPLNNEDFTAALASIGPQDREVLIKMWKKYRVSRDPELEKDIRRELLYQIDYPEPLDTMPFDAIRYRHPFIGNAWAVQPTTNVRTPWGVPLPTENATTFTADPTGIVRKVR